MSALEICCPCPQRLLFPSPASTGYLPNQLIASVGRAVFLFHSDVHGQHQIKMEEAKQMGRVIDC